jgi:hypothetical protein
MRLPHSWIGGLLGESDRSKEGKVHRQVICCLSCCVLKGVVVSGERDGEFMDLSGKSNHSHMHVRLLLWSVRDDDIKWIG